MREIELGESKPLENMLRITIIWEVSRVIKIMSSYKPLDLSSLGEELLSSHENHLSLLNPEKKALLVILEC